MDSNEPNVIAIPPGNQYGSYEEAYNAFKNPGIQHGYGFILHQRRPYNSAVKTYYSYRCDRSGNYQSRATKLQTVTRTTGCPFSVVITKLRSESDHWELQVKNGSHNHPRSLNPTAHNVFRRRTTAQKELIASMTRAGAAPKQILTAIWQDNTSTLVGINDIYSNRQVAKASYLARRTPIEALLDEISTEKWIFDVRRDNQNYVECLFFAHQKQVELFLANSDILFMDCTYRTNRYRLPLLHILGCTNLQTFFSVGFCFLREETEQDYYWAISTFLAKLGAVICPNVFLSDQEKALKNAARTILPTVPQLLCTWHINRNVLTKAQQAWHTASSVSQQEKEAAIQARTQFMARWNQIIYAKTPDEFEQRLAAAWTSQYRHYRTTTTSPIEGMHKVLKDYLTTSQGDLLRVVDRIKDMIDNQYSKYQKDIASVRSRIKFQHRQESMPFLPIGIHDIVTPTAIELVRQQELIRQDCCRENRTTAYTGSFERINGLPCYHTLQAVQDSGSLLRLQHAYLGAPAIKKGLDEGADIILCGRVADASPVIGVAQWWHGWSETDYDQLAGALVAGHLIECSAYVTGANFSGFEKYKTEELNDLGLGIAEIAANGDCVITKHTALNGFVTEDTVRSQLLYEIQGNHYANSDVQAVLDDVMVKAIGKDRVYVTGTKGLPPPPTTKLAVFYKGGYQCEFPSNATATPDSIRRKYELLKYQLKYHLKTMDLLDKFDILDFQVIGVPEVNPSSQLRGTTQLRVFAQAPKKETIQELLHAYMWNAMQHFSGAHGTMDYRTALPMPFLGYYPSTIEQDELREGVHILDKKTTVENFKVSKLSSGHPNKYQPISKRANYEPTNAVDFKSFGETKFVALGDVALGRSGDKGANVNLGLFVHTNEEYDWLRTVLTTLRTKELMGKDWKEEYFVERVEFPGLKAVHFVIYGPLSRGISSSPILDGLGKGFADYIRSKYIEVSVRFLK